MALNSSIQGKMRVKWVCCTLWELICIPHIHSPVKRGAMIALGDKRPQEDGGMGVQK